MLYKFKKILLLVIISFVLFLSIETKHVGALGDIILQYIGLASWSNGQSGTHFTVVYSLLIIFAFLLLIRRQKNYEYSTKFVLLVMIISLTTFTFIVNTSAEFMKGNKEGVFVIGYNSRESMMDFSTTSSGLVDFNAVIDLTNYSDEDIYFSLDISREYSDNGTYFDILDMDEKQVVLHLEPKETKQFIFDNEEYLIVGEDVKISGVTTVNGRMTVIITGMDGEVMEINRNEFWGRPKSF